MLSGNVTSYAKLGLINHSPYVGLGPINSPNKNLPSDNGTSYTKLELINHSPYVGLGPINSPNKNLPSDNGTSYTKLELINHSPYVGLGPINSPNKNLPSDNGTSYTKLELINHSPYIDLGPINSPNQISSQKSTTRNFTSYAEMKEVVRKEGFQVEPSIEVKDHSERRSSICHNDSSYTKMESFYPAFYGQSQKIKPDVVYQNDSLHSHGVGNTSTSNDSRYELSY